MKKILFYLHFTKVGGAEKVETAPSVAEQKETLLKLLNVCYVTIFLYMN